MVDAGRDSAGQSLFQGRSQSLPCVCTPHLRSQQAGARPWVRAALPQDIGTVAGGSLRSLATCPAGPYEVKEARAVDSCSCFFCIAFGFAALWQGQSVVQDLGYLAASGVVAGAEGTVGVARDCTFVDRRFNVRVEGAA